MERFLPGYEQDIEPGAGHQPLPGRRKVILHTTETAPGSFAAVRGLWRGRANWGRGLPHFLAEGDRYVQLLPLDVCAYTSVGGPDAANKAGCPIQVEIVHRAAQPFTDVEYEALGRWLAALIRAGIDLDLSQCPRFFGVGDGMVLATAESPVRQIITRDFGSFAAFNGVCGHQHLRGNDHWDPGGIDIEHACDVARRWLNQSATHREDDMYHLITDARADSPFHATTWLVHGITRRWMPTSGYADLFAEAARSDAGQFTNHGWQGAGSPWIALLDLAEQVGPGPNDHPA